MVKLENVGINGYGRMGKLATRLIKEDRGWDIGLINASRRELKLIYGYNMTLFMEKQLQKLVMEITALLLMEMLSPFLLNVIQKKYHGKNMA